MAGQVFLRAVRRMGLSANSPVAVAVSGGCDSVALTLLARQQFERVVGITVDHRLREGSSCDAEKTGELVRRLGLEHHILTLNWDGDGGPPSGGKIQEAARMKRYPALLGLCERLSIRNLMVAHHMDDQNETFLIRMSKGSGVDGLGGMYPVTVMCEYPRVNILRPLLEVGKQELLEVCRSEGVEWIEDPSNNSSNFIRNNVRKILSEDRDLAQRVSLLVASCQDARSVMKEEVNQALRTVDLSINEKHGFLSVNLKKLLSLSPTIGKKLLQSLILHMGGARVTLHYKTMARLYSNLLRGSFKSQVVQRCVLYSPHKQPHLLVVGRTLPSQADQQRWTPLAVGEAIHWDGRWRIKLKPLDDSDETKPPIRGEEQLYVRHMTPKDWPEAHRGIRRIRAAVLPDILVRGGLPVVSNKDGYIVLSPHFKVVDRSYGVDCDITFEPLLPLTQNSPAHIC